VGGGKETHGEALTDVKFGRGYRRENDGSLINLKIVWFRFRKMKKLGTVKREVGD